MGEELHGGEKRMKHIIQHKEDYEVFKTHYNGLCEVKGAINKEITELANQEYSTSTIRKLLKLREYINEAITFCGETMFDDIRLMIHELRHMEEDFHD